MPITHTPNLILGPWTVEYVQGSINIFHLWDENDNFPPNGERDGDAYARVMSAAPDLLAALEELLIDSAAHINVPVGECVAGPLGRARAAIAKAKA
jgi:hypothetical protein